MEHKKKIKILILAGGKGKRMESDLPKVLVPLAGKPMIRWLLESIARSGVDERPCIVVGYKKELVMQELGDAYDYVVQDEPQGTAHAVMSAEKMLEGQSEHVLVLAGDSPFTSAENIKKIADKHMESGMKVSMATATVPDYNEWHAAFWEFGRILRKDSKIIGIKEYKDATPDERDIREVNTSCYVFESNWLWQSLKKIKNDNAQQEYYLTDLIKIAVTEGTEIESIDIFPRDALGANSKDELKILEKLMT